MGCASSKRIEARVDVYRPAPTSVSIFDINAIEEPWLKVDDMQEHQAEEKASHVPELLLQKLNAIDDAPRTWDEVSKALEDLKPTLQTPTRPAPNPDPKAPAASQTQAQDSVVGPAKQPSKSYSFHTLEEVEAKLSTKPAQLKKTESMTGLKKLDSVKPELRKSAFKKTESPSGVGTGTESRALAVSGIESGHKPVSENIFIVKDRLEKQKQGKEAASVKRDPLSDYPDICPPGGADSVVLYTTSLGGVRRTFEDCNRVRSILELHGVVFDERDVSLHGEFLHELKDLLGDGVSVPRMFVKGKYVGGAEEVVSLNETGRLRRILSWARVERGVGRQGCVGCGGARFVPCLDCGGSCKVMVGDKKERCEKCNENGLVHCPACA